ncbi:hypothetical protein X975_10756, partial [Stegodyphus mimosarum]
MSFLIFYSIFSAISSSSVIAKMSFLEISSVMLVSFFHVSSVAI